MTAIASPVSPTPWSLGVPVPRLGARIVGLVAALCLLLGAGLALAWALGAPAASPTQSQQPAITSPTPN
jgi:hypothetical protein